MIEYNCCQGFFDFYSCTIDKREKETRTKRRKTNFLDESDTYSLKKMNRLTVTTDSLFWSLLRSHAASVTNGEEDGKIPKDLIEDSFTFIIQSNFIRRFRFHFCSFSFQKWRGAIYCRLHALICWIPHRITQFEAIDRSIISSFKQLQW